MLAYPFQEKIHPTCSYLRAFYWQAAPNFAYSFIKFEKRNVAYLFIPTYSMFPIIRTVFFTSVTVHKNTVRLIGNIEYLQK